MSTDTALLVTDIILNENRKYEDFYTAQLD